METWRKPNVEMCVLKIDILSFCPEYELENWLAPSEVIYVSALDLQSTSSKYALETWLVQTTAYLCKKCTRPNWAITRNDCYPNILNIEAEVSNKYFVICTLWIAVLACI